MPMREVTVLVQNIYELKKKNYIASLECQPIDKRERDSINSDTTWVTADAVTLDAIRVSDSNRSNIDISGQV